MRELIFQAEAEAELLESIRNYEQEKPGLGDDFLAEVRTLAARLLDFPSSGSPVFRDVRRARVRRFAYQLIYRVRQDAVIIVAVMHLRRKPGISSGRRREDEMNVDLRKGLRHRWRRAPGPCATLPPFA